MIFSASDIRSMRNAQYMRLMTTPTNYVVTVQQGTRERVAYGLGYPLSKRAATKLVRALTALYGGRKLRAIMVRTAVREGSLA